MRFARQGLVAALAALAVLAAVVRADFVYKDFNDTTGLIVSPPPLTPLPLNRLVCLVQRGGGNNQLLRRSEAGLRRQTGL